MTRLIRKLQSNWILLSIFLLAIFLRLFYYMGIIRGDDSTYARFAYKLLDGSWDLSFYFSSISSGTARIGLYLPAAIFYKIFGVSEFAAILFPLLASILTIFFIYKIASLLANRTAGYLAAFFWATFPLDIFLATQLLPDGPNAMATTGSVFFILNEHVAKGRRQKSMNYIIGAFFVFWALQIKPSSAPIIIVLIAIMAFRYWKKGRQWVFSVLHLSKTFQKVLFAVIILVFVSAIIGIVIIQSWPQTSNNLELTSFDIASAWVLGRINPISVSELQTLSSFPTQQNILTESTLSERFKLLDPYFSIFLITSAYALARRKRSFYLPLIWFGILFFYLEWGSHPRTISGNLIVYQPVTYWIDPRNFLLLCVPVILAISFYISEGIKEKQIARGILVAIMSVLIFVLILEQPQFRETTLGYIKLALLFVFAGGLISPFALTIKNFPERNMSNLFILVVVFTGVASLLPTKQFHVWDFVERQDRRKNLMTANAYLADQPKLPIYGVGSAAAWLDFYADFRYGYDRIGQGYDYPAIRMTDDRSLIEHLGGYFVNYGCGHPVYLLAEWPMAEFGSSDSPRCISLVKRSPQSDAEAGLANTKKDATRYLTKDAINDYLVAAAGAEDFTEFVSALSLMVGNFPSEAPIGQALGIVSTYGKDLAHNHATDLLTYFDEEQLNIWEFGPLLQPRMIEENGQKILFVGVKGPTVNVQSIFIDLTLKSNTAYLLEVDLRSSASFDLVRFPDESIPDSYPDSWNKDLDWTHYQIALITPEWPEGQKQVRLELARIFDEDDIQFRELRLIEVAAHD